MPDDTDDAAEKALTAGGFIATLISIWYPAVGIAGSVIGAMSANSQSRRIKRLEAIVKRLDEKLKAEDAKRVKPELFEEVLARAVQDEDNEKVPFYGALIERSARGQVPPHEIRILANVLQQLTVPEMTELLAIYRGQKASPSLPPLLEDSYWPRMEGLGLSAGTIKYHGNLTELGKALVKLVEIASATEP